MQHLYFQYILGGLVVDAGQNKTISFLANLHGKPYHDHDTKQGHHGFLFGGERRYYQF